MISFGVHGTHSPLGKSGVRACVIVLAVGALQGMAHAASGLGLVTILDGEATLLRGNAKWALAEGVRVWADDIIELGPKGRFVRLEFNDGGSLGLGPDTRVQMAPRLAGERGKSSPQVYVLRGWVKMNAAATVPSAMATPWFDVSALTRAALVSVQPDSALAFSEAGDVAVRPLRMGNASAIGVRSGELLTFSGTGKPELVERPAPAFAQAVPKSFLDSLPARAALFQSKETSPKRLGDLVYADVQPWLDAEAALRKANQARWIPLAESTEFRKGLLADMKAHPEWRPVLFPPKAASTPAAAAMAVR